MIKGLIFDLDGTLTLTQQFHAEAYAAVLKKYGISYTKEEDQLKYAGKGSKIIFPEVFAEHGKQLTEAELAGLEAEKKAIYNKIIMEKDLEFVPGVKEFLTKMQARGMKIIIASGNKIDSVKIILKKTGLDQFFRDIVTPIDVNKPKPAPDLFLFAAKKIGCAPEECIVFEDAVNGVTAAKAGGIKCIALCTGASVQELLNAGATKVIKSYDEMTDVDLN